MGPKPTNDSDLPVSPAGAGRAWTRWLLAAALGTAVGACYFAGLTPARAWDYLRAHRDELKGLASEHRAAALAIFFVLYIAVTALSLPVAAVLSLAGGALFDRWLGTVVVLFAATAGATLAFLSSRFVFRAAVERRLGPRLADLDRGIEREGAYYLFTLRLVPLVPFWLVNLGMGLTRMRVVPFAAVSLLGMLPGTFVYVNAGTELGKLDSPRGIVSPGVLVSFALLGLLPLLLRKLLPRR